MEIWPTPSQAPELQAIRAKRQRWLCDPRDLHANDPLHQMPIVNGIDTVWDQGKDYRYQWAAHNGAPVARPMTSGGLIFNQRSMWWERNGSSWQPDKKTKGGRQTMVDLRHLGVVVQPATSRLFDKAKKLLLPPKTTHENAKSPKETLHGVPTVIAEISKPECAAKTAINLEAKSHILYTRMQPYRIIKSLSRKSCRHPSTCALHSHIDVDFPQEIRLPFVEEPNKMKARESGFLQRSCHHEGHQHLSHEEDPCFSDATEAGRAVQIRENALEQVLELAATGVEAEELERIWQEEQEQERQQEIPMSCSTGKENRPASVSAHTLFRNAAKTLQSISQESPQKAKLRGGERQSLLSRAAISLGVCSGARIRRLPGRPLSWRIKEWLSPSRSKRVYVSHTGSDDEESSKRVRKNRICHRISDRREHGFDKDQWASLTELQLGHHTQGRSRSGGDTRTVYEYGDRFECLSSKGQGHSVSDSDPDTLVLRSQWLRLPRTEDLRQHNVYDDPPCLNDPCTQAEWADWLRDGRPTLDGANLFTRAPTGANSEDDDYDVEDRTPCLRGGAGTQTQLKQQTAKSFRYLST